MNDLDLALALDLDALTESIDLDALTDSIDLNELETIDLDIDDLDL